MRVLVVDDSKTMRNIVKGVLTGMGAAAIEEAGDGQDAMSRVDAFNPDLILLDWNMPVMDGISFVRAYRGRKKTTPIIMVTTEAEKTRVLEAIQAGVNNYAVKPFTPESLSKIIEATLAKAAPKAA